jgi:hypothetical protein
MRGQELKGNEMKTRNIDVVEEDIETCTSYVRDIFKENEIIKNEKSQDLKSEKDGRRKTFNLEVIVVEHIEKHCEEKMTFQNQNLQIKF